MEIYFAKTDGFNIHLAEIQHREILRFQKPMLVSMLIIFYTPLVISYHNKGAAFFIVLRGKEGPCTRAGRLRENTPGSRERNPQTQP